jgi:malate dehydrogenase (oxaloacetate-decarboxylating)
MHRGGKIGVRPTVSVTDTVAVVTDGTAVLGLGDIGPAAAMPVMEGKSLLFGKFAGINAVPICLACTGTGTDEIVATVAALAPSFGGINLEDISAPGCFEIEDRLRRLLDIPVFHDDQHGTAIVTLAALRSAARVAGKKFGQLRAVVAGAGASGIAVTKMLLRAGVGDIAVSDSKGLIYCGRGGLNPVKAELAEHTNRAGLTGSTESALRGADVFPALRVATGRSDFPNQINNSLAFPGVFRGALDIRATDITESMKLAAANAIAALVGADASPGYVVPSQFDERVAPAVAAAVSAQARAEGVARR